jgi:hypothetical protein
MSENNVGELAKKIAQVIARVKRVPTNGRNNFQGYDYATEGDLVDEIRRHLSELNVCVFPSVESHQSEQIGKAGFLSTVEMAMTLVDGDSGQSMTTRWIGQGQDKGDKGYYKAYTGAMKYFLMKTFLISTGDDPELDERAPEPQSPPPKPLVTDPTKIKNQGTRMVNAVKRVGLDPDEERLFWQVMRRKMNVQSREEMTYEQMEQIADWVLGVTGKDVKSRIMNKIKELEDKK